MNIVIIGTGYVGLTSGLGYTQLGHRVACVDTDAHKIMKLDLGEMPFYEKGMTELLRIEEESGRIIFTTDLSSVVGEADVVMIAVGTPATSTGEANLSYVFSAIESLGRVLDHELLLVIKSTVPVGTNRKALELLHKTLKENGKEDLIGLVQMASIPEFLREGTALKDFMEPERVVIGTDDDMAYTIARELHNGLTTIFVKTSIESAELIKYAANAFLATKISFINEIANIAERTGANVQDIAYAIGLDSRIGSSFLQAGIGYGGSCFPKDVSALHQIAGSNGYDFKLLSSVIEANNHQRDLFMKKILDKLGSLKGRQIAVWGLAFKPGTDDVRESAAVDLIQRLYGLGASVVVFDPKAIETAKHILPEGIQYSPTAIDACDGVEALIVLTEWPEFKDVSFETVKTRMIDPIIFDGRNCLAHLSLSRLGFEYIGVGVCSLKRS